VPECRLSLPDELGVPNGKTPGPAFFSFLLYITQGLGNPLLVSGTQSLQAADLQNLSQSLQIDYRIASPSSLDFMVTPMSPFFWVSDRARAHHVEVDISETSLEVSASLDGRRMVAIFPKGALACLPGVVLWAVRPATSWIIAGISFAPPRFLTMR